MSNFWLAYVDSSGKKYFCSKNSYELKVETPEGVVTDMPLPVHPLAGQGNQYQMIREFNILPDGKWICVTKEGGSYCWHTSSNMGATWTIGAYNDISSPNVIGWSYSAFNDIVFTSGYGPRGTTRSAYVSLDYGQTFKKIFDAFDIAYGGVFNEATDFGSFHIHSVCYDPVWDRLWLVNGDFPSTNNGLILYCDNFRLSDTPVWTVAVKNTQRSIQMAAIYPMADCILFGSDNPTGNGIWRLDRSVGKNTITPNDFTLVYNANKKHNDGDGAQTYIVGNFFRLSGNSPVLIAIHKHNAQTNGNGKKLYSRLIATTDGRNFMELYEDTQSKCWWEMGAYTDGQYIYIRPIGNSQNLPIDYFNTTDGYYIKVKYPWVI